MLPSISDAPYPLQLHLAACNQQKQYNPLWFLVPRGTQPRQIVALSRRRFTILPAKRINIQHIAEINLFILQDYCKRLLKKWFPLTAFGFDNLLKSHINLGQFIRHAPVEDEISFWKLAPYHLLLMAKEMNADFINEISVLPIEKRLSSLFLQYLAFTLNQKDDNGESLCQQNRHLVFSHNCGFEWRACGENEPLNSKAYHFFILALCNFLEDGTTEFIHCFTLSTPNKTEQIVISSPIIQIMDKLLTNPFFGKILSVEVKLRQIVSRFYMFAVLGDLSRNASDFGFFAKSKRKEIQTILTFVCQHQKAVVNSHMKSKEGDESLRRFLMRLTLEEKKTILKELKMETCMHMLHEEYMLLDLLDIIFSRPGSIISFDDRRMISYRTYLQRMQDLEFLFSDRIAQFKKIGGFQLEKGHSEFINAFFKNEIIELCYVADTFRAMLVNLFSVTLSLIPKEIVSQETLQGEMDKFKLALKKTSYNWNDINQFLVRITKYLSMIETSDSIKRTPNLQTID